jgi:HEPN domain-containing protein
MKTAVEWLFNQLLINNIALDKGTKAHCEMEQKILEQAKEMEKEQIQDAFTDGDYNYFYSKKTGEDFENGIEYYNEKFKKDEQ